MKYKFCEPVGLVANRRKSSEHAILIDQKLNPYVKEETMRAG